MMTATAISAARAPFRARHRKLFGRLWCRYTCGWCGAESWWLRPLGAAMWAKNHNPDCWEVVPGTEPTGSKIGDFDA